MTLTPENLTELKNKLFQEKERLEGELGRITKPSLSGEHTTAFTEIGSSEDDNASEVEEYTDNLALENSLEKQLHEIIEALDRMNQNSYGRCEKCHTEIPVERLMAYPAAKTCTKC